MANRPIPSPKELNKFLKYDPDSGLLTWRRRGVEHFSVDGGRQSTACKAWNIRFAGKPAFTTLSAHGYMAGGIFRRTHVAHRVIWAMVTGAWPEHDIDHINGIRHDNRLKNLREVRRSVNGKNQRRHITNTSGTSGVTWCKRGRVWAARITVEGQRRHLGYFDNKASAIMARVTAERKFGFHANHGSDRPGY